MAPKVLQMHAFFAFSLAIVLVVAIAVAPLVRAQDDKDDKGDGGDGGGEQPPQSQYQPDKKNSGEEGGDGSQQPQPTGQVSATNTDGGNLSATSTATNYQMQYPDEWSKPLAFIQNCFGPDQSQKGLTMISIVPPSLQVYVNVEISAKLKLITLKVFETEFLAIIGVIKTFISQLSTPNPVCPCVNSAADLWARFQSAGPNLYAVWQLVVKIYASAWTTFIKKVNGNGKQCVQQIGKIWSYTGIQASFNSTYTQVSQGYFSLPQPSRAGLGIASGSLSATIGGLLQFPKCQKYFGLSGDFQSNAGMSLIAKGKGIGKGNPFKG